MQFTQKYKLHKLNFNISQIGGTKININSIKQPEYDVSLNKESINQITDLPIKCSNMTGVNEFHLRREMIDGHNEQNKIYYNYDCVNNHGDIESTINQTPLNEFGNGDTINLNRHNVNCNNKPINEVELKKNVNGQIQYSYKCANLPVENQIEKHTNLNDYGNGQNIYLDRHIVACDGEQVLTQFNLEKIDNQFRYNYRCGTIKNHIHTNDIPFRMPDTQSWLFMPLICACLNDLKVVFPLLFKDIFNFTIEQFRLNYADLGILNFNSFDEFITRLRTKLNDTYHIASWNDIQTHVNPQINNDGVYHIQGDQQELILYSGGDEIVQIFMQLFIYNVINRLSGQKIYYFSNN
jgi:hypothetical protein